MSENEAPQVSKPKATRTSTHKTRTGCVTCKKRHIRCDEAKPQCSNCVKSRRQCEGYAQRSAASSPGQACWDSKQMVHAASPKLYPTLDTVTLEFLDDLGMNYFQEFVGLTQAPWLSAARKGDDLWDVTLPQLAHSNNTLRYAAMAIGALGMWHRESAGESSSAPSPPATPTTGAGSHYFHAVTYYCHALKLQSRHGTVQDAVFLSVLLLFFEVLRGDKKAAMDHVNHGLALLLDLLTDPDESRHVQKFAPNPKPLLASVSDIFTTMAKQALIVRRGRVGHGLPLPNLTKALKDKQRTVESFISFLSQFPKSTITLDHIPAVFDSLDEFEQYWLPFRRSQNAITPLMIDLVKGSGLLESNDATALTNYLFELFKNPQIAEFCEKSSSRVHALNSAFEPLFNKIVMYNSNSPEYLRAIHLRLQFLSVYILDDMRRYLNVHDLQTRTPYFREFLSLAEIALRAARPEIRHTAHQVSLQCELAWHLMVTAITCRDPLVRDEATRMLEDYPGQDGLWNRRSLYLVALKNREVELTNAKEGDPAEQWQRLWRREFAFEDAGDRIRFRFLDKDSVTGEWQLVEEMVDIPQDSADVHWKRQILEGTQGLLNSDLYTT